MKKNKLFVLLTFMILVLLLTAAANCNFCGTSINIGEDTAPLEGESTSDQSGTVLEQTQQQGQQAQDEGSAPTITLEIIEGPLYSAEDDVCYWRIEATITGDPLPGISWSRDDSEGTLGENISQVNLHRDSPEYTLVCTAKNSVDTVTEQITLAWACDGEEDIEDPGGTETDLEEGPIETRLGVVMEETGFIMMGEDNHPVFQFVLAGDFPDDNIYASGFVSFDISSLIGVEIVSAYLTMNFDTDFVISGDRSHLGNLRIGVLDYGTGVLSPSAADIPADLIKQFPNSTTDISFSGSELVVPLQENIDQEKERFQLKIYWSNPGNNNDGIADYVQYLKNDIFLDLGYLE